MYSDADGGQNDLPRVPRDFTRIRPSEARLLRRELRQPGGRNRIAMAFGSFLSGLTFDAESCDSVLEAVAQMNMLRFWDGIDDAAWAAITRGPVDPRLLSYLESLLDPLGVAIPPAHTRMRKDAPAMAPEGWADLRQVRVIGVEDDGGVVVERVVPDPSVHAGVMRNAPGRSFLYVSVGDRMVRQHHAATAAAPGPTTPGDSYPSFLIRTPKVSES